MATIGPKFSRAQREHIVDLIRDGLTDDQINSHIRDVKWIGEEEEISASQMRRYRAGSGVKINLGKLTEEARQVASARYSGALVDAVRLNRAAAKKMLKKTPDGSDELTGNWENAALLAVQAKIFFDSAKLINEAAAATVKDLNIGGGGGNVNILNIQAGIYAGLLGELKAMVADPDGEGLAADALGPEQSEIPTGDEDDE